MKARLAKSGGASLQGQGVGRGSVDYIHKPSTTSGEAY